jgi:hypothetical protein
VKYSKILSILGISCVVTLLLIFGVRLQAQNESKDKITTAKVNEMRAQAMQRGSQFRNRQQGSNWGAQGRQQGANLGTQGRQQGSQSGEQGRSESSESKDKPDFYRVIVDNNIFRPLGWRPPNKEPEYTFVGTRVDSNGAASEAYVLETRSNQFFMANIGDKIGDAIVKEIKQKEIILDKNGEVITLRGGKMAFLQTGGSRGGPSRGSSNARNEDSSNGNRSTSKSSDKENASAKKAQANAQKMRQQMMERAQEMRRRYEGASREQREQMMREFRGRGRGRRDR